MKTFAAFLRGINVGGHRKIKMADLRRELLEMGLVQVQTYVQSGNIVFASDEEDPRKLEGMISEMILDRFGHEVPVLVKEGEELSAIVDGLPFVNREDFERAAVYFVMLAAEPQRELISTIDATKYAPDEFVLVGKNVYLYVVSGYGKSKLSNNLFESKWKVAATTRNLKTMLKMLDLLS